jgi:hypothetical protein
LCRYGKNILSLGLGQEEEEDLPEDLETSDRCIAVPHKNDMGLDRRVALAFVDQELSDEYDTVAGFFGRRGAYGRFKALLHARRVRTRLVWGFPLSSNRDRRTVQVRQDFQSAPPAVFCAHDSVARHPHGKMMISADPSRKQSCEKRARDIQGRHPDVSSQGRS